LNPACARGPWLSRGHRAPLLRHLVASGTAWSRSACRRCAAGRREPPHPTSTRCCVLVGRHLRRPPWPPRNRRGLLPLFSFQRTGHFVAAGARGPKRGDNAASRPARVPRWAAPLKAPPAVPLSEGEDASGATPAVSTPPGTFAQSAPGFAQSAPGVSAGRPNRIRRPSIRHSSVSRRPSASAYNSCSCRRMRLASDAASSPLRTSTAR